MVTWYTSGLIIYIPVPMVEILSSILGSRSLVSSPSSSSASLLSPITRNCAITSSHLDSLLRTHNSSTSRHLSCKLLRLCWMFVNFVWSDLCTSCTPNIKKFWSSLFKCLLIRPATSDTAILKSGSSGLGGFLTACKEVAI